MVAMARPQPLIAYVRPDLHCAALFLCHAVQCCRRWRPAIGRHGLLPVEHQAPTQDLKGLLTGCIVLPCFCAVLCNTGGALLLAATACCLFSIRRRHKISKAQASLAIAKGGAYDPAHSTPTSHRYGLTGCLLGSSANSSGVSRVVCVMWLLPFQTLSCVIVLSFALST